MLFLAVVYAVSMAYTAHYMTEMIFSIPDIKRFYVTLIKKLTFVVCLVFLSGEVSSMPPQKIIHPGDWAYDAIALLSREQGIVFFADSRLTVTQMERIMAEISTDTLSESGRDLYSRLKEYLQSGFWLNFQSDALSGGMDIIFQPEGYYKTNENTPWIYNDHSRNPVIQLPVGFSLGSWITAEMDLYLWQNEYASTLHRNNINIPLDPVPQTDIHFPKRAYVSAGLPIGEGSGFNFAIGLGDNFFGKTRTGSIIISEYLERNVYAQATIYSPSFKYTSQVLQYEVNKYHYMHYLQVRPHRKFSISLAEGVMVAAPLELRFLNPFTVFHSYESFKTYANYNNDLGHGNNEGWNDLSDLWGNDPNGEPYDRISDPNNHSRIGSYFGVKIEYQPVHYLRLYGLFVMDQFNLPMKKTNWMDTLYPDAAGFQAGADVSIPVRGGYVEMGLEGVYTYPYLYVMWDKSWSFYKEVPELDNYTLRYWTGSPFGPDTIAGTLWAGFRSSSGINSAGWYGGLSYEFTARGEHSELSVFDRDNSIDDTYRPNHTVYDVTVSPTGTPIFSHTIKLRGEYYPREYLNFTLQPGYRINVNAAHIEGRTEHGFEMAFSMRLRLPVK